MTVEAATGIVVAPVLKPLIEQAQKRGDWDEADRLIRKITDYDGEDEACYHLRIRGLIARNLTDEALERAAVLGVGADHGGADLGRDGLAGEEPDDPLLIGQADRAERGGERERRGAAGG